jgi:hypothetical protein
MPKLRAGSEYVFKEEHGGPLPYPGVTDFEI